MTDQYLQEQFIGKTYTEKLNEEIGKYFVERKFSKLGFLPRPGIIGVCKLLDENKEEILNLGGSAPDDQINDNLGKWLAPLCSPINQTSASPAHAIGTVGDPPRAINGIASGTPYLYNRYNSNAMGGGGGFGTSKIQLGDDATVPLITDFELTSPLPLAPEGTLSPINGSASYTGGANVNFVRQFGPTSGTGIIREMGWFISLRGGQNTDYMMSHDIINPTFPYNIGQFILAEYIITI